MTSLYETSIVSRLIAALVAAAFVLTAFAAAGSAPVSAAPPQSALSASGLGMGGVPDLARGWYTDGGRRAPGARGLGDRALRAAASHPTPLSPWVASSAARNGGGETVRGHGFVRDARWLRHGRRSRRHLYRRGR
jgi:hypothetical protein